jgi:hypothetical protein
VPSVAEEPRFSSYMSLVVLKFESATESRVLVKGVTVEETLSQSTARERVLGADIHFRLPQIGES